MFNPTTWKKKGKKRSGERARQKLDFQPPFGSEGTYRVGHIKDIPRAVHSGRNTFPNSRALEEHEHETAMAGADGDKGHSESFVQLKISNSHFSKYTYNTFKMVLISLYFQLRKLRDHTDQP